MGEWVGGEGEIPKEPNSPLPELILECLSAIPSHTPTPPPPLLPPGQPLPITSTSLHDPALSPRPEVLAYPIPVPPRGLGAGEGLGSSMGPCVFVWGPSPAQLLDSVLGLGALGLTIRAVFSTAGPALLLLLLLVSFLAFDLLHR